MYYSSKQNNINFNQLFLKRIEKYYPYLYSCLITCIIDNSYEIFDVFIYHIHEIFKYQNEYSICNLTLFNDMKKNLEKVSSNS